MLQPKSRRRWTKLDEDFTILSPSFTSGAGSLPLRLKTISSVLVLLKDRLVFLFELLNAVEFFSKREKNHLNTTYCQYSSVKIDVDQDETSN